MRINQDLAGLKSHKQISTNTSNSIKELAPDRDISRPSDTTAGSDIQVSISKEGQTLNNENTRLETKSLEAASRKIKNTDSTNESINAKNSSQSAQRKVLQSSEGANKTQQKSEIDNSEKAAIALKSINEMILKQSSNAMLAQSNQTPQKVLQLLK
ncbi:hypothetical protein [Fusibacter bizertensis]